MTDSNCSRSEMSRPEIILRVNAVFDDKDDFPAQFDLSGINVFVCLLFFILLVICIRVKCISHRVMV